MYPLLTQYLNYLKNEKQLSHNSYISYERDLQKFTAFLEENGVQDWASVHKHHLMKYMALLQQFKLKPATISRHIVSIKALFHYLVLQDHIVFDPSIYLESPKQVKASPQVIAQADIQAIIEQCSNPMPAGLRDRAMLELMYATGIRVSELVALNIEHLHLPLGFVQCISPSMKERYVPIGQYAKQALEAYLQDGREQLVTDRTVDSALFLNHLGTRMTRQGFWKNMKQIAKQAGIEEVSPHMFRHSVASHLLENGADIRAVQEMLGHADITSTMKYTTLTKQKLKDAFVQAHPRA